MIRIFAPIQQETKHGQEKLSAKKNEKFVDKAQQCFAFLYMKSKFKFACFLET